MIANTSHEPCIRIPLIFLLILLIIMVPSVAAQGVIDVQGDFSGEIVGYDEDQNQNKIEVSGEFTVSGEEAQNVQVTVEPSEWTVLDAESADIFVEEGEITFDKNYEDGAVVMSADRIPVGTTVRVEYDAVFVGGTTQNSINAGTITVQYETEGGTPDSTSFESTSDMENSADRTIDDLNTGETISTLEWILARAGFVAILILALIAGLKIKNGNGGPEY